MRVAFISDVHGNATALEAVMDDIQKKDVDQIVVLGDLCFRGPEPKRSLQLVREITGNVIKGNADEWVIRGIHVGEVPDLALPIMRQEQEWTRSQLDDEDIDYLQNLPTTLSLELEGFTFQLFHATPDSLFEVVAPTDADEKIKSVFMKEASNFYIYGHIHLPYIRYIDGRCVINTGSVGMPFDGLNYASYCLIELKNGFAQSSIVRVQYDVDKVVNQFQESDYPNKEFMMNVIKNGHL